MSGLKLSMHMVVLRWLPRPCGHRQIDSPVGVVAALRRIRVIRVRQLLGRIPRKRHVGNGAKELQAVAMRRRLKAFLQRLLNPP